VLAIISGLAIVLAIVASRRTATVLATYHLRSRRSRSGRHRSIRKSAIRGKRNTIRFKLIRAANSLHDVYIGLRFLKNGVCCF